jgi:hypothetical protein
VQNVGGRRRGGAGDLIDALGAEADGRGGGRHVDVQHVADRLPHVERVEQREQLSLALDEVGEAVEDGHAVPRRHAGPTAAAIGRQPIGDGPVHIGGRALADSRQNRAGGGVDRLEMAAGDLDHVAADEGTGFKPQGRRLFVPVRGAHHRLRSRFRVGA